MTTDLSNWTPCPKPERITLEGRFVRLEPLSAIKHGGGLYAAETAGEAEVRFRFLPDFVPNDRQIYSAWLDKAEANQEMMFWVVVDQVSGEVLGRQTLMRIDAANGVIETGNIHWGANMQRSPKSTEAFFLHASYVFDTLGYRRFEWKLNNLNQPSHNAARRFGFLFEGIFRQHLIFKGQNRDTAWYAMIDKDWPMIKQVFEHWLHPDNFDSNGLQKQRLEDIREQINGGQAKG